MQFLHTVDRDEVIVHPNHTAHLTMGAQDVIAWGTEMHHNAETRQYIVDPEGRLLKVDWPKFCKIREICMKRRFDDEPRDAEWVGEPVEDIKKMDLRGPGNKHLYVSRFEKGRLVSLVNWWNRNDG